MMKIQLLNQIYHHLIKANKLVYTNISKQPNPIDLSYYW
jgi:hypothetical protein